MQFVPGDAFYKGTKSSFTTIALVISVVGRDCKLKIMELRKGSVSHWTLNISTAGHAIGNVDRHMSDDEFAWRRLK